jgi:hypothetical protein
VTASVAETKALEIAPSGFGNCDPSPRAFILHRRLSLLLPPPRHRPFQFAAWPWQRTCPTFRAGLASSDDHHLDRHHDGHCHHDAPTRDANPRRRASRDARDERSTTTPPLQRLHPTKCAFPILANSV